MTMAKKRLVLGGAVIGIALALGAKDLFETGSSEISDTSPAALGLENIAVKESQRSSPQKPNARSASNVEDAAPMEPVVRGPAAVEPVASESERASLRSMAKTLSDYARPRSSVKDLVADLKSAKQEPVVARNSNPDTGEMVIVRTKSPLPGTRYFHAQFFADENDVPFVQHMSFEYKPSPRALDEAIEAVQSSFGLTDPPVRRSGDFAKWRLDNGYAVWIKKMSFEDLRHDPFNAYTRKDEGVVRVVLEQEIHEDGESDEH